MPHTLSIPESRTHVRAQISEPLTVDAAWEILCETRESSRSEGIRGFLLDTRGFGCELGPVACYEIAYTGLERLGFDRDWMWAILVSPGEGSYDFLETVVRNAGYRCRLFHGEPEVIAWLQRQALEDSA